MLVAAERDLASRQNCLTLMLDNSVAVPTHCNEFFRKARDVGYLACDCNWCWI